MNIKYVSEAIKNTVIIDRLVMHSSLLLSATICKGENRGLLMLKEEIHKRCEDKLDSL